MASKTDQPKPKAKPKRASPHRKGKALMAFADGPPAAAVAAKPKRPAHRPRVKDTPQAAFIFDTRLKFAEVIYDKMAQGMDLLAICRIDGMPSRSTVDHWAKDDPLFADCIARGRQLWVEAMDREAERILADPTEWEDVEELVKQSFKETGRTVIRRTTKRLSRRAECALELIAQRQARLNNQRKDQRVEDKEERELRTNEALAQAAALAASQGREAPKVEVVIINDPDLIDASGQ